MTLQGKKILLAISGSIAAYKSAILVRFLIKEGANVRVIMTQSAHDFITPLTLATLSRNAVVTDFMASPENGTWNNHVELGLWPDIMLIAPASAHTLAKCANGICSDLLVATYLSARCAVVFAPAMDLDMYQHGSTIANINALKSYGNSIINAQHGELASGLVGEGRMTEPEQIIQYLEKYFYPKEPKFIGKKVLITAGPTQEDLDPVRFISNHSSGKMGYAIAKIFAYSGASVEIISGPVNLPMPDSDILITNVRSAQEMFEATQKRFAEADIIVLAAAVADYTPAQKSDIKIKKKETTFAIEVTQTTDIAATLGKQKKQNQFIVGFALETNNELENAKNKLHSKNVDLIILNSLQDHQAGFGYNTNKITAIDSQNNIQTFNLKSKEAVAQDIVALVVSRI